MKISKTAVLTAGSALMLAGLGLMFVSAADKTLYVNPNNAIQHFETVRIIPTESGDNSMADIVKIEKLFGIKTDYNFALSMSGTEANQISGGSMGSSILGGIINKILGGKYNGILGGKNNQITTGNNNGILGGENNRIDGNYSVIFGGKDNKISLTGSYSAIVGGSGNTIDEKGSYSVVVGEENILKEYNSVVMGSKSNLKATSSFLWTDGNHSDPSHVLKADHVFAVLGDNGMVINTTGAHNLAQLTISGSLVVYDDKNAPECTPQTKGVLKVVTGDNFNTNQECFCSCDGSGRNALHDGNRCPTLCGNTGVLEAECGGVQRICTSNPYYYTGDNISGACVQGDLVRGTGAFFVSSQWNGDELENYINWSCQAVDGKVKTCEQKLEGNGCPNLEPYECNGTTGNHVKTTNTPPTNSAEFWTYDPEGYEKGKACTFICDEYSHWDSATKECVPFECVGDLEEGETQVNGNIPMGGNKEFFYGGRSSSEACAFACDSGYDYDEAIKHCRKLECDESSLPDYAVPNTPWNGYPTDFSQDYEYKESGHDPCTFHCEGARTYKDGACVDLKCKEPQPDHTAVNAPYAIPDVQDKPYFFSDSMEACAVHCISPRTYVESEGECVLNLQNCSVDLVESKYGIVELSAGHKASTLGSSGPWTCEFGSDGTLKPFADVCDSDTVSSFDNTVSSVEMNEGYVFLSWIDESGRILSNTLNALNLNCGEKAILKWKCDEDNDYGWNGSYCEKGFEPIVYECEGEDPGNADLIPGTDEGLDATYKRWVYESAEKASGKYCAYLCKTGFTYVENYNTPQCVKCVSGTYNSSTKTCQIEVGCRGAGYAFGPKPGEPGTYACLREGSCMRNSNSRPNYMPDEGGEDVNFRDARPLGDYDGNWACVEGTPSKYMCQYKCKESYYCDNGKCKKSKCSDVTRLNLYGSNSYVFSLTDIKIHIVPPGKENEWEHVGESDNFPQTPGCYYKCIGNAYYGKFALNEGCIIPECESFPQDKGIDEDSIVKIDRPVWYWWDDNHEHQEPWTYSGNLSDDARGCYYRCKTESGYTHSVLNGVDVCLGGMCSEVTKRNLYGIFPERLENAYSLNILTGMKNKGGAWAHLDESLSLDGNIEDGCHYQCTGNTYFGSPESPYPKGCIERKCPDLPWYLSTDSIVPTEQDPKWYNNYNPSGYYVHDDDWTYLSGSVPTSSGCFYRCNTEGGYREIRLTIDDGNGDTEEVVACTADKCPLRNKMFTFGNDYWATVLPNDDDYKIVKNGWNAGHVWMWEHIDENTSFPSGDGCYYHCSSGTYYGEYVGYMGCFELSCNAGRPNIDNIETIEKPGKYLQTRTYSGTATSQTQATGCFYKCASGYNPKFEGDKLVECVKKDISEPSDPCIDDNGNLKSENLDECCLDSRYKYMDLCKEKRKTECYEDQGFIWEDPDCIDVCQRCKEQSMECGWNPHVKGCSSNVEVLDCSNLGTGWYYNGNVCVSCPIGEWNPESKTCVF